MTNNTERCSCGAREKNKCNKESTPIDGVRYGKMCVKELKEDTFEEAMAQLRECVGNVKSEIIKVFPILNLMKDKEE